MTHYVNESIRISHKAYDYDNTAVTNLDVDSVTVTITNAETDAEVVAATAMDYADGVWTYVWSGSATAGVFKAKCTITAGDATFYEYVTIRVQPV